MHAAAVGLHMEAPPFYVERTWIWRVDVQTSYIESEPDNDDPEEDESALHRSALGLRALPKKVRLPLMPCRSCLLGA